MDSLSTKGKPADHLVIIGSGPVGMTAALMFKDHFKRITLLEKQSRDSFLRTGGFTFPIVFTPASIKILKRVGAWEAIEAERSEFFGVVVHKRLLGRVLRVKSAEEGVYSHWRNHIVNSLYQRVRQEQIEIHFESRVEGIDFTGNVVREARLGELQYDLLIGADGINSQTRRLMAQAHPDFSADDFNLKFLDNWYAYRLPARGAMREKFGGGDRFYASNVFVDNLPQFPAEKFRVVTTSMKQPEEEISVLVKYDAALDLGRVEELNEIFFDPYIDSRKELRQAWQEGYGGKFEQVEAPTFKLHHALLLGDAAHGFESTGDLINLGLTSVGSFYELYTQKASLDEALRIYDETIGESLRYYARFSLRRSHEKVGFEIGSIELAAKLGLANRHPGLFGIYVDDFEIQPYMASYQRDIRNSRMLVLGLGLIPLILAGSLLF